MIMVNAHRAAVRHLERHRLVDGRGAPDWPFCAPARGAELPTCGGISTDGCRLVHGRPLREGAGIGWREVALPTRGEHAREHVGLGLGRP
jgi:hypothetical protein